ncbi:hypothetical protein BHE74_00042275 [Ensete ventricosum]|nr:hypothetical protein BHE74_00042275 [Ensete ventricosum]
MDHVKIDYRDDFGSLLPVVADGDTEGCKYSVHEVTGCKAMQFPGASSPSSAAADKLVTTTKEYPVDAFLPDVDDSNSVYGTDEFRMFCFKVLPCSMAYCHDWTACPFVHPGESARRRDPRKYAYGCFPCLPFRSGACPKGDMCEYAHGVFERWLHPMQYRTRMCKDGTHCARRVCFFAHTSEELRASLECSPFLQLPCVNIAWPELHLLALNDLHRIRNRSSLVNVDDLAMLPDCRLQQINDLSLLRGQESPANSLAGRKYSSSLFSAEISSPPGFTSSHQLASSPQQHQSLLFSPKAMNHGHDGNSPPCIIESSPCPSYPIAAAPTPPERLQRQLPAPSAVDDGSTSITGSSDSSRTNEWIALSKEIEQEVNSDVLGRHKRSTSFELGCPSEEEADVSWVQSLVGPPEMKVKQVTSTSVTMDA